MEELHERAQGVRPAEVAPYDYPKTAPRLDTGVRDLVSLRLHEEAVRRIQAKPELIQQAQRVLARWRNPTKSLGEAGAIWATWYDILSRQEWASALEDSEAGRNLRRFQSPLVTLLPREAIQRIGKEAHEAWKANVRANTVSN